MITPTRITDETAPQFLDNLKSRVYMVVWVRDENRMYIGYATYGRNGFIINTNKSGFVFAYDDADDVKSRIHSYLVCSDPKV